MYSHNLKQDLECKRDAAIRQAQRCESNAEEERIKHLDNIKRSKELREQAAEVQQHRATTSSPRRPDHHAIPIR